MCIRDSVKAGYLLAISNNIFVCTPIQDNEMPFDCAKAFKRLQKHFKIDSRPEFTASRACGVSYGQATAPPKEHWIAWLDSLVQEGQLLCRVTSDVYKRQLEDMAIYNSLVEIDSAKWLVDGFGDIISEISDVDPVSYTHLI